MKRLNYLLLLYVLIIFVAQTTMAQSTIKLWFDKPATYFEESLVLGNGKMGASVFGGVENCNVSNCCFVNAGGTGVHFDLNAQRNKVGNCEFAHLGEAGIILGGYGLCTKDVNHHNDIINNFIVAPLAVPSKGYLSYIQYSVKGTQVHHNIIISLPDGGMAHDEINKNLPGAYRPNIEETEMDSNLYYHPTDPIWVDEHLIRMQAVGKEKTSLVGDPLFIDPKNGNFGFRKGSPALKLGIEPLDVSKMV